MQKRRNYQVELKMTSQLIVCHRGGHRRHAYAPSSPDRATILGPRMLKLQRAGVNNFFGDNTVWTYEDTQSRYARFLLRIHIASITRKTGSTFQIQKRIDHLRPTAIRGAALFCEFCNNLFLPLVQRARHLFYAHRLCSCGTCQAVQVPHDVSQTHALVRFTRHWPCNADAYRVQAMFGLLQQAAVSAR
jgi:hypothetical protein